MITEYFNSLSKNAPVVIMAVLGLATFYKSLGIDGRWLFLSAFATGFILGGAFQVASLGTPSDFAGWFWTAITAILMGLAPSGVYDALKAATRASQEGS